MLRSSTNKSITCFHLGRAGQLPRNSDSWRWPLVTTWSKCSCWLRWTTKSGFDNYWVCRKHMGSPYSREFTTRHGWFITLLCIFVLMDSNVDFLIAPCLVNKLKFHDWLCSTRAFSCQTRSTHISETLPCFCMPMIWLDRLWQNSSLRVISPCWPAFQAWWL